MIVYGDPSYEDTLDNLVSCLRARIESCAQPSVGELRTLLIMAGQVEQAACDGLSAAQQEQLRHLRAATRHLAECFYAAWALSEGHSPAFDIEPGVAAATERLLRVDEADDTPLTVKLPEGFAFYGLYPEQYCTSALRWLADHPEEVDRQAAVVGIRSIGTTLAAVVAATLRAGGWEVADFTVRPTGHPFERTVDIAAEQVGGAKWALAVDEGPGMSGSSMAAVGEALLVAGVRREGVSFFPGHAGEPGSAASEGVRQWWATTPRYVTTLDSFRMGGRTLTEELARLVGEHEGREVVRMEDAGGGQWRKLLYSNAKDWPAAAIPFERPKYVFTLSDGRQVLLKFEGLCGAPGGESSTAEAVSRLMRERGGGQAPQPMGIYHGFVAVPWLGGTHRPLRGTDLNGGLIKHIGRYMAQAAGPPLAARQAQTSVERLSEMLYWNTWEALGEQQAERTSELAASMREQATGGTPSYGDGRMAPHEWLVGQDGTLAKVDSAGHVWDHTCVGVQAVTWDVAGAVVEWGMDEAQAERLLNAFYSAGGPSPSPDALRFYSMAYAAFRAGQCHMCANMLGYDPAEQERLWAAYGTYREQLSQLIAG